MPTRKSTFFFAFLGLGAFLFALMASHAHNRNANAQAAWNEKTRMVERLELTDLCLFTDARYARHPSMADRHTPFQDSPMAMEHFPSGALVLPPPHLRPQ
jgi:hypothetical protein